MNGTGALDLPPTGVVLITGPIGAGKSSLIEAVAVAGWGKTIREAKPWRADSFAYCRVDTHCGLHIHRLPGAGGLKFWRGEATPVEYATTTKAQIALNNEIIVFDAWRRAFVFSSEDAQHLSMATDGDRKRLFEQMLGLYAFDAALNACRTDLKQAKSEFAQAASAVQQAQHSLLSAQRRIASIGDAKPIVSVAPQDPLRACEMLDTLGEEAARKALLDYASAAEASAQASLSHLEETLAGAEAAQRLADLHGECARGLERRAALLDSGACPTCERPNAMSIGEEAASRARAERREQELAMQRCNGIRQQVRDLKECSVAARSHALLEVVQSTAALEQQLRVQLQNEQAARERADRANAVLVALEARVALDELSDVELYWSREVGLLSAVESVLGLKGPRGAILSQALSGVSASANEWLPALGASFRVRLRSFADGKNAISNAITIEVDGAGGGYGYKACSAGERRKIDLAILFGLGAITTASVASALCSTVWMDEVADHLDANSIACAADAIHACAENRCVVVITHREELQRVLKPEKTAFFK